jgi:6-phosphogluconolactonase (cycloisomerase 2 family)
MKLINFCKPLLMCALSAGLIFGISSCISQSYSVGYLYVTGTVTANSGTNGIISGFSIDHNTGKLTAIHQFPVASGGSNPVRAVLTTGSRFLYVLNRGVTASGSSDCTTDDPCQGANITQFVVGGNGILTPQQTFFTQGTNPFRVLLDSSGGFMFVLDHDAPLVNGDYDYTHCSVVGTATCGDITVFKIDGNTGRLSLVTNSQLSVGGALVTYFPVPANPVDFVLSSGNLLTLSAPPTATQTSFPYTGGSSVFPYTNNATGGLTINANSSQPLGIGEGTALVNAGGFLYVLDNEPVTSTFTGTSVTYPSQILPFTVGSSGALLAAVSGIIPDASTLANPTYLLVESKNKFIYVINQGNNVAGNNAQSGIAGYTVLTTSPLQLSFIAQQPFGSGAGPQCIVEDPSNQFIYTANSNDSTVTGRLLDQKSGILTDLNTTSTYSLNGPATWCLMNSRTN